MSVPNVLTMSDVKKHKKKESVWMVINNEVYDVTKFLNEHPGGEEALLDHAGKDATQAFEDVGHSSDAREMMKKYKIGTLPSKERKTFVESCCRATVTTKPSCRALPKMRTSESPKSWHSYDGSPSCGRYIIADYSRFGFHGLPLPPRYPVDLLEKDSRTLLKLVGLDPTKSKTRSMTPKSSMSRSPRTPKVEKRVDTIVVPRERRRRHWFRPHPPPPPSNKWKWILLALGVAVIAGVAYKKYSG